MKENEKSFEKASIKLDIAIDEQNEKECDAIVEIKDEDKIKIKKIYQSAIM